MVLLTTGVTLSDGCRLLSSASNVQALALICGSVVNNMPTWISPFFRADTVFGPAVSSGTKSLNSSPYVSCKPLRQYGRSGHSGGPPKIMVCAIELAATADPGLEVELLLLPSLPQAKLNMPIADISTRARVVRRSVRIALSPSVDW